MRTASMANALASEIWAQAYEQTAAELHAYFERANAARWHREAAGWQQWLRLTALSLEEADESRARQLREQAEEALEAARSAAIYPNE